ncbi:MAG: DUF2207 domain-containing protein [Luteimonas sp.]
MTMRALQCLLLMLSCLLAIVPVRAEERILSYDSAIQISADGSLDVVERIKVRAEGDQIRRGIYRDIPTRYRDRYGNRVVIKLEVLGVQRDGQPEPWFTESRSNGLRINTGNDDLLPVPAEHAYALHYRATRQLGFFANHDELYWNAIGTGWAFPIERSDVEVSLPRPVPIDQMHAEGYTGAQGEKDAAYSATLPAPGIARWTLTQPLAREQGFTIVLSFPKGLVAAPTQAQKLRWFLKDNRGVLAALATLLLLLVYCVRRWLAVGRDPPKGVVIARYEPPQGRSPAGLRYMQRMSYDTRCFSSDLLQLAVDGKVRIHREKHLLSDQWELERVAQQDDGATPATDEAQAALFSGLFADGASNLELRDTNAAIVSGAQSAHTTAIKKQYQPAMFQRNGGSIGIAFTIALVGIVLSFAVSGGGGVLAIILAALLMIIVLFVFASLIKAPTAAGRALLDEIEGLKTYLGVAERDELAHVPGPDQPPMLDAKRYEHLLPYAVALEVEDAWTKKFTLAVGAATAAATTAAIGWYRGGGVSDLGSLSHAVGSSLSSQISSSASPPGSSSGGGGGGSSGGGGGGGGGGGR